MLNNNLVCKSGFGKTIFSLRISVTLLLASVSALGAQGVNAKESLAKSKACLSCHAMEKNVLGPSFADVKAKYSADEQAVAYLAGKIQAGGKGVWGMIPMPKQNVTDEEAKLLAAWILGR